MMTYFLTIKLVIICTVACFGSAGFSQNFVSSVLKGADLGFLISDAMSNDEIAFFSYKGKILVLKGEDHNSKTDKAYRSAVESRLSLIAGGVSFVESLVRGSQYERLYKYSYLSQHKLRIEGLEKPKSMLFTSSSLCRLYLSFLLKAVKKVRESSASEDSTDQQIYDELIKLPESKKFFDPIIHRLQETVIHLGSMSKTEIGDRLLAYMKHGPTWSMSRLPEVVFRLDETAASIESQFLSNSEPRTQETLKVLI